ncbi:MAG: radical SAM protein [Candidatus Thermoplasmatota archaeon]|nr:radical SAM protein [Candidatus Thermoplasmatota archaeon]
MKSVYGPVASWRLGKSLGIDLICSHGRICSFDCVYCQLQKIKSHTIKKGSFVTLNKVKEELTEDLKITSPDVITFSGTGEPTLSEDFPKAVEMVKSMTNLPLAILTNSTMFNDIEVRSALNKLDIVVAKLDAPNEQIFNKINRPVKGITFEKTLSGIKKLRREFNGKLCLQIMFIKENLNFANKLSEVAGEIQPDEVQINTPLRPCPVPPLNKTEIIEIKKHFNDFKKVITVYEACKKKVTPMDIDEIYKRKRFEP